MRGVRLALLCALLLGLAACGTAGSGGEAAKGKFVAAADRICASHLKSVMTWLNQPSAGGAAWEQQAVQDEGLYEIIAHSIRSLEGLGPAPDPKGTAFAGYVKSLKARAALYRLTSVAFENRDTVFALQLENRINDVDTTGDRYAHTYGLQICGTGIQDVGRAFKAAGWDP